MGTLDIARASDNEIDRYLKSRTDSCLVTLQKKQAGYSKIDEYVEKLIQFFSVQSIADLRAYEEKIITREEFLVKVRNEINRFDLAREEKDEVFEAYQKFMWSYDVIDGLINDPGISDIKLIDPYRIMVKRQGIREISEIAFRSPEHYRRFIYRIAVRNQINLSSKNATQHFTDVISSDTFRMRFNITTELINSNGYPSLHIRKIPKFKYSIQELVDAHMGTKSQFAYLLNEIEQGHSTLVCGQGGSGKTTLMNLLLDYFPHDTSILCIQNDDELFSDYHPDLMCQITVDNKDSEVRYELKDLARNGLLLDIDWFVVGEIKGEEARYLFDAACTGANCMASLHSSGGNDALIRLADLAKRASDYSQRDILRILSSHFHNIVFMHKFRIVEMLKIKGWDDRKEDVVYERVTV